jgi:HlyD family secretion protein|tara:strand:+ start:317 stop:1555 length:1239 start_codon:yes stop_codon:yes gene_type:complete
VHQYIDKKDTNAKKKVGILGTSLIIVLLICFFQLRNDAELPTEFYTPQKITLQKNVRKITGLGKVVSKNQLYISSPEDGQIIEIFIRQGQKVAEGEPIIKMSNLSLQRETKVASYELANIESDVELKKSELGIMRYQLEASLSDAETELQIQQLTLDANELLVESGIVSKIKFAQEKISLKRAELNATSKQKQLELFEKSYSQQISALNQKIEAGREKKQFFDERIEALTLFSHKASTVRNLDLQIGQSITQGQNLVELIDDTNLIAEIQIPQYSVDYVAIGDVAQIITPNGKLNAKVDYIDSVIRNGAATVFIAFQHALPSWIKIDQSIEVLIDTHNEQLVSTLEKPDSFDQYESWTVYKTTSQNTMVKTNVSVAINTDNSLTLSPFISEDETVFLLPTKYASATSYPFIE